MDMDLLPERKSIKKRQKKTHEEPFEPETFTVDDAALDNNEPNENGLTEDAGLEVPGKHANRKKHKKSKKISEDPVHADHSIAFEAADPVLPHTETNPEDSVKKCKKRSRKDDRDDDTLQLENSETPADETGASNMALLKGILKNNSEFVLGSELQNMLAVSSGELKKKVKKPRKPKEPTNCEKVESNIISEAEPVTPVEDSASASRKIKKLKKNKAERAKAKKDAANSKASSNSSVDPALTYLRSWKHTRDAWTFQKVRQVWLLRNWRDCSRMSDEDFAVFIEYIADLKGGSRGKTATEATEVKDAYESSESFGTAEELRRRVYDRAGEILVALS